ncbi:MAG: hypothetical protein RL134_1274 [Actinomycetota bacterium]
MPEPLQPGGSAEPPVSGPPDASWSRGVELGARGRYADASDTLLALLERRDRWHSLALSTLASHRRQIGEASEATRLDLDALHHATDAESRADALIGLAADAVALGDSETAVARLANAEGDAREAWRTLTRWHWVGAELALLTADRAPAADHARAAVTACDGRSARHAAKSRIILAAATGSLDDLASVGEIVEAAGWVTLEWPLALVAADHAGGASPPWIGRAWESGRRATVVIEEGLPTGLQRAWRSHPGVRRLRDEGRSPGGE